jgi:hypothetical protein
LDSGENKYSLFRAQITPEWVQISIFDKNEKF